MSFGNWLWPLRRRQLFSAASASLKIMASAVLFERHPLERTVRWRTVANELSMTLVVRRCFQERRTFISLIAARRPRDALGGVKKSTLGFYVPNEARPASARDQYSPPFSLHQSDGAIAVIAANAVPTSPSI